MKIRLIEAGYENMTGMFGEIEFVDGMSVHDISPVQARFLSSIVRIENIDGTDPGENARFQSAFNMEAPSFRLPTLAELEGEGQPAEVGQAQPEAQVAAEYTQESLEAIADKGGIAGLREIADPLGVKGTSIAKLIEGILAAQAPAAPAAATLPEGQPNVVTTEQAEVPQE